MNSFKRDDLLPKDNDQRIRFCGYCGAALSKLGALCIECGNASPAVPVDFSQLVREKPPSRSWGRRFIGLVCLVAGLMFGMSLLMSFLFLGPGFYLVFFGVESYVFRTGFSLFQVPLQELPLLGFILLTFSIIIGSMIFFFVYDRHNILRVVKRFPRRLDLSHPIFFPRASETRPESAFLQVAQLDVMGVFCGFFFIFLFTSPQTTSLPVFQTNPTSYTLPTQVLITLDACVWEEIFFRGLCLGLPLFLWGIGSGLHARYRGRVSSTTSRWSIRTFFLGDDTPTPLTGPKKAFLILSSGLFGWAHLLGGWPLYKFFETFVIGLGLGYLFLTRGLTASIVLHFGVNYMRIVGLILIHIRYLRPDLYPFPSLLMDIWLIITIIGLLSWTLSGGWVTVKYCQLSIGSVRPLRSKKPPPRHFFERL
ncbi:MAG: CPBP family intramembrane glutamic endopeptidase [Candidatus Hodarchaeota archaeon]